MTIILGAASPSKAAFLSDLLISRTGGVVPVELEFPSGRRKRSEPGPKQPVRLQQKMYVLGPRHVVMWAGDVKVAMSIARELLRMVERGEDLILGDAFKAVRLTGKVSEGVAMQLWTQVDDGRSVAQSLNCEYEEEVDARVLYAGSGQWHFVDSIEFRGEREGAYRGALHGVVMPRLAAALCDADLGEMKALNFAYGGGFEIGIMHNGQARKLEYSVRHWDYDGSALLSGPAYRTWYDNHHFFAMSYRPEEKRMSGVIVPDPLDRSAAPTRLVAPTRSSDLTIHIIHLADGSRMRPFYHVGAGGYEFEVILEPDRVGFQEHITDDLREQIKTHATAQVPVKMIRPQDWVNGHPFLDD
ncbi:hypothetical protein [Caulobacter sp. BP25]|uniref:hypothetical protein n=1 Tax=Caulobacter sp. BP25 TaxID=2048900 RepID=UPI000C129C83|nr:hypothetical protein [Caulobacter sp. BP25]PHY20938.1 hypothetical protein CSW59_06940 [Caulobacter sp. BP25]